jgi:hypothetical protein
VLVLVGLETQNLLLNMVAECFNDFFINVAKDIGNVTVVDKKSS